MYLIFDDIILGVIIPFLNKKDKFSFKYLNKRFYSLVKKYNQIINETYFDIYHYFNETIYNNMKNNEYMLLNCNFFDKLKYKKFIENSKNGIYYYSKGIYYREYNSILHPIPYLSSHSHNIYVIILIAGEIKRSFIIKKYFDYDVKYSIDNVYINVDEMVIQLY
jgi:hypothetical protein